jgi:signal transduction histidine kinase
MKSLRARVTLLLAGFGLATAALLVIIVYQSVREYYNDWLYDKSTRFAERILEAHPDLWRDYMANPDGFGQDQLRQYTLYSPDTGLYLLDAKGSILASAGEPKPFWSGFRVDLDLVRALLQSDPDQPIVTPDPDRPGEQCIAAVRPVLDRGELKGWLFVVPRQGGFVSQIPDVMRGYGIRTAIKIALMTIAIGVLLSVAMLALLTRPLTSLTRAAERVRDSDFREDVSGKLFPDIERNDEIGMLSRAFRDTFERLKLETQRVSATDAKRREMVASVSHDLRTPLTALIGQLETIRIKGDSLPDPARRQLLEQAMHSAQQLRLLTDALADLSRIDSPDFKAQPEPIAIGELADDVVQRFLARANAAGVALEIDYPDELPLARLDAALVERALSNLLDNALRVTPANGRVLVRVRFARGEVRIEVVDTGPGVAPEDQPRVFERFYQASRARDQRGASGLGLAIVKRVAELHGGRAGLLSEPGQGSTFFIELPAGA